MYHLHNSIKFTERVWKEANTWEKVDGKHIFRLEILDYLLRGSENFGNFLVGHTKISLPFTFQPNYPHYLANGKEF